MNNLNIEFQQLIQQFSNSSKSLLLYRDYHDQKPSCLEFHSKGFQNLSKINHTKIIFDSSIDSGFDPP